MVKQLGKEIKKRRNRNSEKKNLSGSWLSVGLKMMIGGGIVSTICFSCLIYFNYQFFSQVGIETNVLLSENLKMNQDLRNSIFNLQKKYLEIPNRLKVDPGNRIKTWLKKNYVISDEQKIRGRENYRSFFNRSQRRDISKGRFVVKTHDDGVLVFRGLMNQNGKFSMLLKN